MGLQKKMKTALRLIKQGHISELYIRTLSRIKAKKIIAKGGVAVSAVTCIVTHRCTLKCKNCAALIQYFKSPKDIPRQQVFRDIDLLMSKIDYTHILLFVGGEIFSLKEVAGFVEYSLKYKNQFGLIVITTNGTILPSDDELNALAMFRKYINIEISDYGDTSPYLNTLQNKLHQRKIICKINNNEWKDWQRISNEPQNGKRNYQNCLAAADTNFILCNGKLYHCGFLAAGETLGSFPFSKDNHVDLLNPCAAQDIVKYKSINSIPPGCNYCGGYTKDAAVVPTAEQITEPLDYKIYS